MSLGIVGEQLNSDNLASISDKQLFTVIGGGKGDEGKGLDAFTLATKLDYELLVSPIGGPNAGHTVDDDFGNKFVGHNMPGSSLTGKTVFLGQGKYINIEGLKSELEQLWSLGANPKVKIANSAHLLFPTFHGRLDGAIEDAKKDNGNDVGTTCSGIGPGVATRGLRNSLTIGNILSLSNTGLNVSIKELIEPFNPAFIGNIDEITREIKNHLQILESLISEGKVEIVDDMYARDEYNSGNQILVEGAQSPSLGMYGGAYPFNTSTDTSFSGIMSSLGITPVPDRVGELLIVKSFPTAVGNHEFPERVSHIFPELLSKEVAFRDKTRENGSTTGRPRMIGFPSPALIADYLQNDPYIDVVSIRKLDVLGKFRDILGLSKLPIVVGYDNGKPVLQEIDYSTQGFIDKYREVIGEITGEDKSQIPFILGYGPKPSQSRIQLS